MKFAFVTHCETRLFESFGCKKLLNSFKYFHPDIEIIHLNELDINRIIAQNPGFCLYSFMPLTMLEAKKRTNADVVIHLDADSIVLDELKEILLGDYDVAGVRNNCDNFIQNESVNRPYPIKNLPNHLYLNCGCVAVKNENFLYDWYNLNKSIIKNHGKINHIKGVENDTFNIIFHTQSKKYKTKILDPLGGNCFYGPSSIISNYSKPCPESVKDYGMYHWQSWMDIKLNNGKPELYGKKIPLIHHCFGGGVKQTKLSYDLFNADFAEYLKKITQCEK